MDRLKEKYGRRKDGIVWLKKSGEDGSQSIQMERIENYKEGKDGIQSA
jgi:hypothetical protein